MTPETESAIRGVLTALESYRGEVIVAGQHPLHAAVCVLERLCVPRKGLHSVMPRPAMLFWFRTLAACRPRGRTIRPDDLRQMGTGASPTFALEWSERLRSELTHWLDSPEHFDRTLERDRQRESRWNRRRESRWNRRREEIAVGEGFKIQEWKPQHAGYVRMGQTVHVLGKDYVRIGIQSYWLPDVITGEITHGHQDAIVIQSIKDGRLYHLECSQRVLVYAQDWREELPDLPESEAGE